MAQAVYKEQDKVKRFAQQRQAQAAATIEARAAAKPVSIADGLTTTNATQAEFDQAMNRAKNSRGGAGSPSPVANGLESGTVQASRLTPAEAASFNQQTGGKFQQTFPQAPTVDNVRARTNMGNAPMPGIADDLVPAAAAKPSLAYRAGRVVGNAVRNPGAKLIKGGGAALAVIPEAIDMGTVAAAPGATRTDIATQAAESTGKLATAWLGAKAGAAGGAALGSGFAGIGAAPGAVIGGIAGGAAGYFGGEKLIEKGREFFGANPDSPAEQASAAAAPAAAPKPDFSNVRGGSQTFDADAKAKLDRQAANDGITPVNDRVGDPSEVLGTFNGRKITRGESDKLAGSQSFGGPTTPSIDDGLGSNYRPSNNFVGQTDPGAGAEARLEDISDSSTPAGRLYAQLAADKTPTGKRVAAQFLSEYLGTGTAERGQNADLRGGETNANASLMRGRDGDAAGIEQARVGRRGQSPQYTFNEDGSISQISDGIMSPVLDQNGKPAKGAQKGGQSIGDKLELTKKQDEIVTGRIGKLEDYGTPEEYQAARAKAIMDLFNELNPEAANGG